MPLVIMIIRQHGEVSHATLLVGTMAVQATVTQISWIYEYTNYVKITNIVL